MPKIPKIEWTESLATGALAIDSQHRAWIQRYNDFIAAINAHKGPDVTRNTLAFLIDYTRSHFALEEKAMAATDYPETGEHKAKHEDLLKTLANLESDLDEEGPTHALAEHIQKFLGNWLVNHIKAVDVRLGAHLKARNADIGE
jgi:hemerythrin